MKLALITGGCRRLGATIAARLAEAGWTLALHGRDDVDPDPALRERLAACATDWRGFAADLADGGAVRTLVARVADGFGAPPKLLVNNASLFGQDGVCDMTIDTLTDHFAVNSAAPAILARDVAALATADAPAAIVNILDQRILHPGGDQASYTLSKLALAGATRQLSCALAPRARVNAVAPGLTLPTGDYGAEQMARLAAEMPLARLPGPEDIADAILYFATAGTVTGQTLFVDGGAHLRSFARDFVHLERD